MDLDAIRRALLSLGSVQKAVVSTSAVDSIDLDVNLANHRRIVQIRLSIPAKFPVDLPTVVLLDTEPLHLAHVNYAGTVCVIEDGGLSCDLDQPAAVAVWWLTRTVDVLEASYAQAASGEFSTLLTEFAGYWLPIGKHTVELIAAPAGEPRIVTGYSRSGKLHAVDVTGPRIDKHHPARFRLTQLDKESVAYLPLIKPVLPPVRGATVGARFIASAIKAQPPTHRRKLNGTLRRMPRKHRYRHYLLSQRAPNDTLNVVGLSIKAKRQAPDPVLEPSGAQGAAIPWNVSHHYRSYQLPRGGALSDVGHKSVAIVGCGALGGALARLLVQSGVGKLHLIDPDIYSIDNVYRHALPSRFVGTLKTEALRYELTNLFPGVQITSMSQSLANIEEALFAKSFDVICLATGNPNVERDLVRRRLADPSTPALVSGWIEPVSLGGHIITSRHGQPGCLECNFHTATGASHPGSRVSFLADGQSVQQTLMGCAGSFTPYTATDAMQSAVLMARVVQDLLVNSPGPFYQFWRGNRHQADANSVKISHWYSTSNAVDPQGAANGLLNSSCSECGSWHP